MAGGVPGHYRCIGFGDAGHMTGLSAMCPGLWL